MSMFAGERRRAVWPLPRDRLEAAGIIATTVWTQPQTRVDRLARASAPEEPIAAFKSWSAGRLGAGGNILQVRARLV